MDAMLTEKQAAEILGLAPGTLAQWRFHKRTSLKYVKLGRAVRYRPEDIEAFAKSSTVARQGGQK